jgi:hypothetical protein
VLRGAADDPSGLKLRQILAGLFARTGGAPGLTRLASEAGVRMKGLARQAGALPLADTRIKPPRT